MIDTHAHLYFPDFEKDMEVVLERAHQAGITHFINIGTNRDTSEQAIRLAKAHESMYAAVGIHPNEVGLMSQEDLPKFEEWVLEEPKVVALGEIGLDYYRNRAPEALQRQILINFFKMAERHKKPVVLHIRDAYEDVIRLVPDFFELPVRGVAHCFSGTPEDAEKMIQLGFHLSFAGQVTYPKNDLLREAVQICPPHRLMIETDAPYLPPQSVRGKRNEPCYIVETLRSVAELKQMSAEDLGRQVFENAKSLFGFK